MLSDEKKKEKNYRIILHKFISIYIYIYIYIYICVCVCVCVCLCVCKHIIITNIFLQVDMCLLVYLYFSGLFGMASFFNGI